MITVLVCKCSSKCTWLETTANITKKTLPIHYQSTAGSLRPSAAEFTISSFLDELCRISKLFYLSPYYCLKRQWRIVKSPLATSGISVSKNSHCDIYEWAFKSVNIEHPEVSQIPTIIWANCKIALLHQKKTEFSLKIWSVFLLASYCEWCNLAWGEIIFLKEYSWKCF